MKFKKSLTKVKSDRGDSILTGFLIMAIPVILLGGIAVDTVKNMNIRSQMVDMAQRSTQASVKTVKSNGSLDWDAAQAIVKEYDEQRFSTEGRQQFGGTTDDSMANSDQCNVSKTGLKLPHYKITLDTARSVEGLATPNAQTVTFENIENVSFPRLPGNQTYRVVEAQIQDATPNFMLGMMGMPCQEFTVTTSAIAFGENSDLR